MLCVCGVGLHSLQRVQSHTSGAHRCMQLQPFSLLLGAGVGGRRQGRGSVPPPHPPPHPPWQPLQQHSASNRHEVWELSEFGSTACRRTEGVSIALWIYAPPSPFAYFIIFSHLQYVSLKPPTPVGGLVSLCQSGFINPNSESIPGAAMAQIALLGLLIALAGRATGESWQPPSCLGPVRRHRRADLPRMRW